MKSSVSKIMTDAFTLKETAPYFMLSFLDSFVITKNLCNYPQKFLYVLYTYSSIQYLYTFDYAHSCNDLCGAEISKNLCVGDGKVCLWRWVKKLNALVIIERWRPLFYRKNDWKWPRFILSHI